MIHGQKQLIKNIIDNLKKIQKPLRIGYNKLSQDFLYFFV